VTANLTTGVDTDGDNLAFSFENVRGGGGADVPGNGIANRIEGGGGDDTLDGRGAADQLIGGAGLRDLADYASRPGPITASLDGVANDPDGDILDVEDLRGTPGNDKLLGGPGSNRLFGFGGDDKLDGRAGNDALHGDAGNDLIGPLLATPQRICLPTLPIGLPRCELREFVANPAPDGVDVIDGGDGNDWMSSVDGVADAGVNCGTGTDGIEIDASDPAPPASCETVVAP
jgi:Ca2+-binding RTX toxin-like protein